MLPIAMIAGAADAPASAQSGEAAERGTITLGDVDALIRREFAQADHDGDGALDHEELAMRMQGSARQQASGLDLLDWIRWDRTDLDRDGRIEYGDIFQIYAARIEDLDRNGDGRLTPAERQASQLETLTFVACIRPGSPACAAGERRQAAVQKARHQAGRAYERPDWWARRYYRLNSSLDRPFYGAVRGYKAWHELWDRMVADHGPKPANPAIDFSRDMLVIAAAGPKPSGGYRVQIIAVRDTGRELVATAVRSSPGKACGATAAITSPVDVVRVPKSAKPIRWNFSDVTTDCR